MTLPLLCGRLGTLSRPLIAGTTPTSRPSSAGGRDRPVWRVGPALLGAVLSLTLAAPAYALLTVNLGANDTLSFNGSSNEDVEVFGSGRVSIPAGASVGGDLRVHGSTRVTISGGSVSGYLQVYDSSTVDFSAGSLNRVGAFGSSTVNVTGGSISQGLVAFESSTVNVTGGSINSTLEAQDNSHVIVTGSCLLLAGGRLTGTLLSGAPINVPTSGPIVLHGADTQPPTITCPANLTVSTEPGKCDAMVNYPAPPASDNCPGVSVVCNPPSGFRFPMGQTTVTCTAIDRSGNTATCAFKVTVNDTETPTIICPPSVILPQDPGMRAATFVPTPAQAQDNCPGVVVTGTRSDGFPITDHTYPVGATVLTWTATDTSGNQATCTQEIDVHDSRIVGVVGLDSNGNHLPDPPQEPRLKGVTIELRDPAADELWFKHPETKLPEPLAITRTDEVGNFSFPVAPPGVYDVAVKLAPGQTISALFPGPSQKAQIVTVNGEPRLRVTMQAGDTVAGLGILLQ